MTHAEAQAKRIDDKAESELQAWLRVQQKYGVFIANNTGRFDPTPNGNPIGRGLGDDAQ